MPLVGCLSEDFWRVLVRRRQGYTARARLWRIASGSGRQTASLRQGRSAARAQYGTHQRSGPDAGAGPRWRRPGGTNFGHRVSAMSPAVPSSSDMSVLLEEAAQRLAAGSLVAFPTETVYGLGADAEHPQAIDRKRVG